jgi:hypothetical protein
MGVINAMRGIYASHDIEISTTAEKRYTACAFTEVVI